MYNLFNYLKYINNNTFIKFIIYNKRLSIGLIIILFIIINSIFAPIISPHNPYIQNDNYVLLPPCWMKNGTKNFILGTDALGRDILSRLIYGSRFSLFIGINTLLLSLIFGVILGLISGYISGVIDFIIMRITNVIASFPTLLFALILISILGSGLISAIFAISITYQTSIIRLIRNFVLLEKDKEYVISSKILGSNNIRIIFKIIFPNCLGIVFMQTPLIFTNAILDSSALGFLGMGLPPQIPEWGNMLAEGQEFILTSWWIIIFPGITIMITVISLNLIGDGLRDFFNPILKNV